MILDATLLNNLKIFTIMVKLIVTNKETGKIIANVECSTRKEMKEFIAALPDTFTIYQDMTVK